MEAKKMNRFVKKILGFFFVCFLSCQQNEVILDCQFVNLTPAGKVFIECLKNTPEWQNKWDATSNVGSPLFNEATLQYSGSYGYHYILPLEI